MSVIHVDYSVGFAAYLEWLSFKATKASIGLDKLIWSAVDDGRVSVLMTLG